jgi:hypothetical protein
VYIGGLKVGALRADLMTNWQAGKYESFIAFQNDAAKNSLRRSAAVNIPRYSSSAITHNRSKAHVPMPSYKSPHGSIGQSSHHGSHNNYGVSRSKGASRTDLT